MKILVYGINYYPELTGIGKYTSEMCEWLVSKGHTVEIITAMPYYPKWEIEEQYRGKLWHEEMINGVKVLRCPLYVPKRISGISRVIHEISFKMSSLYYWFPRFFKNYDAVIAICPPLISGFYPIIHKLFHKSPFYFHIQDLQVDAAKELGLISNKSLLYLLEGFEKWLFKKSTFISSISEGMRLKIEQKGVRKSQYLSLPNWVDSNYVYPISKMDSLRSYFGFSQEDKIVLYSGNMGEKQGLEMVINVAERFKENKNLFFVLVGEGAVKSKLLGITQEKELENVKFFGLQPYEKLSHLLSMADFHLVIQKGVASDLVLPSKLMTILAVGGVSIVTASKNTSLYNLINNNNLGIIIEPDNEEALYKAIKIELEKDHTEIQKKAREFAVKELCQENILSRYELFLTEGRVTKKINNLVEI